MPTRSTDRLIVGIIMLGVILLLTAAFTLLLAATTPDAFQMIINSKTPVQKALALTGSLPAGMFIALLMAFLGAQALLIQFVQSLYALSPKEATKLVWRIMVGVYKTPPLDPIMLVTEGRPNPDGPEILYKVGGPGHLSVGHDTAVVLARGGTITRVVCASLCRLEAFERIWDKVDLRPQNREFEVAANTRDGIPITCKVEARFRMRRENDTPTGTAPPPIAFTEKDRETVLKLTTSKVALGPGQKQAMTDWMRRVTNGTIDGEVRNYIEQYRTDELFDPTRSGPSLLTIIEEQVQQAIREQAWEYGVKIDYVHLTSILPDVNAISEQWLELWRSEWQFRAAQDEAKALVLPEKAYELAHIRARAELLDALLEPLKKITAEDAQGFSTEVLLEFLRVMRSLAEKDPLVQSTMFQQLESLNLVINQILEGAGDTPPSLPKLPPKV